MCIGAIDKTLSALVKQRCIKKNAEGKKVTSEKVGAEAFNVLVCEKESFQKHDLFNIDFKMELDTNVKTRKKEKLVLTKTYEGSSDEVDDFLGICSPVRRHSGPTDTPILSKSSASSGFSTSSSLMDPESLQSISIGCRLPPKTKAYIDQLHELEVHLELLASNSHDAHPARKSWFASKTRPNIPMKVYLAELLSILHEVSPAALIHSLAYIDLLVEKAKITLSLFNIHRLILTSIVVSSKYVDDNHYSNSTFAKFGLVELSDLNAAETEFLFMLEFDLFVEAPMLLKYSNTVFTSMGSKENADVFY
mmetsp:Transcript_14019/g.21222  ORF Transcript_14019/g.21222 Transcript_14019/m.21222 type:complete len:307 (-) Transcript_14019:285-1205(-)